MGADLTRCLNKSPSYPLIQIKLDNRLTIEVVQAHPNECISMGGWKFAVFHKLQFQVRHVYHAIRILSHSGGVVGVGAPVVRDVVVVVGGSIPSPASASRSLIILSVSRFASFCFAQQRAVRSRELALRRSMMVAAASLSLILLFAARFSFFCFARLRAMRSRALALRRSMMVALVSIAGCCRTKLGVVTDLPTQRRV